jgi:hypothetical protein
MWTESLRAKGFHPDRKRLDHCIMDIEEAMTKRLEDAIKRLTPEQVEQLTLYAQSLQSSHSSSGIGPKLTWMGALRGVYGSGLEAQDAAKNLRITLATRSMPR